MLLQEKHIYIPRLSFCLLLLSIIPSGSVAFGAFDSFARILPSFNIRGHDVFDEDKAIDFNDEIALDDELFGLDDDDDDNDSRSAVPPSSIFGPPLIKNGNKKRYSVGPDGRLILSGMKKQQRRRSIAGHGLPKLPYPYIAVPYPIPIPVPYPLHLPAAQKSRRARRNYFYK